MTGGAGMRTAKWLLGGIVATAAIFGLTVAFVLVFSSADTRLQIKQALQGPYLDGRDATWHTAGGSELIRANNDHFNIALQFASCFPNVNFAWGSDGPPASVSVALMLGLMPSGEESWSSPTDDMPILKLTNFHREVLSMSRSLAALRTELAESAARSRANMVLLQISSIIIGAVTTILVSLKAMSDGTTQYKGVFFAIGIFAIVFSAIGTAVAGMNSFLSPTDSYNRSERSLQQARQMQNDLEFFVGQQGNDQLCRDFDYTSSADTRNKWLSD